MLSSSPAPTALTNCSTASLLCCCSSRPREGGKLLFLPCPAACSPRQHEGHEAAAPSSGSKASTGVHSPHTDHPRCPSPVFAAPPAPARGWCFSWGHQGAKGQGKSSTASAAPVCPVPSRRSCPRPPLPSSRAALSRQGRKSGKPCLRAHMEGLGRCPSFSSKKKCTSHGINILVCLLLSSPQAPAQKPQQQPSAQPSWHSLPSDPHSHQRLPRQKPVQSHLGAWYHPNPLSDPLLQRCSWQHGWLGGTFWPQEGAAHGAVWLFSFPPEQKRAEPTPFPVRTGAVFVNNQSICSCVLPWLNVMPLPSDLLLGGSHKSFSKGSGRWDRNLVVWGYINLIPMGRRGLPSGAFSTDSSWNKRKRRTASNEKYILKAIFHQLNGSFFLSQQGSEVGFVVNAPRQCLPLCIPQSHTPSAKPELGPCTYLGKHLFCALIARQMRYSPV